jgi:signal transduction histidine kinase
MAVDMLQLKSTDEASRKWLDVLRTNTERGGNMVRQVLSFARGVEGERVALQPKHLIKEIVKILRETLPKSIEINFQIPKDLWIISADATQIHQVLMNLCVNARDAMPEGGSISITAENAFVDENYARMHLEAKPGRFVMISSEPDLRAVFYYERDDERYGARSFNRFDDREESWRVYQRV